MSIPNEPEPKLTKEQWQELDDMGLTLVGKTQYHFLLREWDRLRKKDRGEKPRQ